MISRYKNASALREALEHRLKQQAIDDGHDLNRLRRLVVFDRLATRLSTDPDGNWVLKGGAVMEFRLSRARMTKDLDPATRLDRPDGEDVRDRIIEALAVDTDGDGFIFQVKQPMALAADAGGRGAWRFAVEVRLAGKQFAGVRMDVAARGEELALTEQLPLPNTLEFAGTPARSIEAVDRRQHFAEKLHALTRDYGDRSNTRIKDLADLVLLIESPLDADSSLMNAVRHVFSLRNTHPVPHEIDDPPAAWMSGYPDIARGLTTTPADLASAMRRLRHFWAETLKAETPDQTPAPTTSGP